MNNSDELTHYTVRITYSTDSIDTYIREHLIKNHDFDTTKSKFTMLDILDIYITLSSNNIELKFHYIKQSPKIIATSLIELIFDLVKLPLKSNISNQNDTVKIEMYIGESDNENNYANGVTCVIIDLYQGLIFNLDTNRFFERLEKILNKGIV